MSQELNEKFKAVLEEKKLFIVCAESVTAGLLASEIASVTGASAVLKGSIVTYNKDLKIKVLKVDPEIIRKHTAESMQTTIAMVEGLKKLYEDAEIYVAVTGKASPSSKEYPTDDIDLGQIFIAIDYQNELSTYAPIIEKTDRNEIRLGAVEYILNQVLRIINT